jgi:hypothetical protein
VSFSSSRIAFSCSGARSRAGSLQSHAKRSEASPGLGEIADLNHGHAIVELALLRLVALELDPTLEHVVQCLRVAQPTVETVERLEQVRLVAGLFESFLIGLDGAPVVLQLVFGDAPDACVKVLGDLGLEGRLRSFRERVHVLAEAVRKAGQSLDVAMQVRRIRTLGERPE